MEITRGKLRKAQKVLCYGPEGIGKSSFAAQFPNPLFSDVEDSTIHIDVARLPKASSWTLLKQQAEYVRDNPNICDTYVVDTADWAEILCVNHVCSTNKVDGIEGIGYGKGYVYLSEEFGRFLNILSEVIDKGVNVVMLAHAKMRKFEQPDEMGAYDRWELKLSKQVAPLVKEWADAVLFANYKTIVVNVDNQGATKGKNKAQGGTRTMYTQHHPCWDAKNRWGLSEECKFEYSVIAPHIPTNPLSSAVKSEPAQPLKSEELQNVSTPTIADVDSFKSLAPEIDVSGVPKALADLMVANEVQKSHIQEVVAKKGYFPVDTPVENLPDDFINGVLIAAWNAVYSEIKQLDSYIPF